MARPRRPLWKSPGKSGAFLILGVIGGAARWSGGSGRLLCGAQRLRDLVARPSSPPTGNARGLEGHRDRAGNDSLIVPPVARVVPGGEPNEALMAACPRALRRQPLKRELLKLLQTPKECLERKGPADAGPSVPRVTFRNGFFGVFRSGTIPGAGIDSTKEKPRCQGAQLTAH
jgi:hypothetical protein